jgi:hypothetical protein
MVGINVTLGETQEHAASLIQVILGEQVSRFFQPVVIFDDCFWLKNWVPHASRWNSGRA